MIAAALSATTSAGASGVRAPAGGMSGRGTARAPLAPRGGVVAGAGAVSSPAAAWVAENLGRPVVAEKFMGGSSWSSTYVLTTEGGGELFVKTAGGRGAEEMFAGEAAGLRAMFATRSVRVPEVFHAGPTPDGRGAFIVMERLELGGRCDQRALGEAVARMHLAAPADPEAAAGRFGFSVDNTIGGTPQPNAWAGDWVEFYRERRLRHQLGLLGDRRLTELAAAVLESLEWWFEDAGTHPVRPATLHGDLWSGNYSAAGGEPAVFDPATYYGHAEAEWGMSWCAGFSAEFWAGYHAVSPPAPLFERRRDLYTLYHYLNHANLFGGGYASQCEATLRRLNEALRRGG